MSSRDVVVHYHLFKNAGSSVDQLLKHNFSDKWMAYDRDASSAVITAQDLEQLIIDSPEIQAFSSHQIIPPLPEIEGNVYPIVFLRDPIDRIKSAYLFEWKKQIGLDEPKGSLEEYIKEKFTHRRKNSIEEFQTVRLSNVYRDRFHSITELDDDEVLENGKKFIKSLSFVGIVNEFDRSAELMIDYLKPAFPDFEARDIKANVLQDLSLSRQQKRDRIQAELSAETFEMILERNKMDETLYQFGLSHFESLSSAMAKKAA